MSILLLGNKGFLGNFIYNYFKINNIKIEHLNTRLEDKDLYHQIKNINPKYIICAAGIVGKPNRDWCNINPLKTIETNILSSYNLAVFCQENNIKICFFGTIGIFNSKIDNKIYEDYDIPNNLSHVYLLSKYTFEFMVKDFENVLVLRLGHCLSLKYNAKNLLTKIVKFRKVHDEKMSITILEQLFPYLIHMLKTQKGIINFVSPNYISLKNILEIYKQNIDNNFTYDVIKYEPKYREVSRVNYKNMNRYISNIEDANIFLIKNMI
jgi:dTDP-4-dehydrorhamnose reductase